MSERPYYAGHVSIGTRTLVARTCHVCGLILGAKHYTKIASSWRSTCNSCQCRLFREKHGSQNHHDRDHEAQSVSEGSAHRRGYFWTLSELELVTEALEAGFPLKDVAILINRTYYATSQAVTRFGLRNSWPTKEQWLISLPIARE